MKHVVLVCVTMLALLGAVSINIQVGNAEETQIATIPDVPLSKLLENYALETPFGNVYFNLRDMHNLIHAAARLKPIDLGLFTTDKNMVVKVKALAYDRGKVTFDIICYGVAPAE